MRNVLIVTYNWPPSAGAPMNRILRFYKYLPHYGWNPIILTIGNGLFPSIDLELENEVRPSSLIHKTRGDYNQGPKPKFTPYGFTDQKNRSLKNKFIQYLKVNIIPDNRIYWLPEAIWHAYKLFRHQQIDLIFSSSPPQTNHVVAYLIKKIFHIKWVSDIRDVWNEQFYVKNSQMRHKPIDWMDKILEKKILSRADQLISVSPDYSGYYEKLTSIPSVTIYNGFDSELYPESVQKEENKIIITYSGSMSYNHRPVGLFNSLTNLKESEPELFKNIVVNFYGDFPSFLQAMIVEYQLTDTVHLKGFLPYPELIKKLCESSLLILNGLVDIHHTAIPSKLFDYIGTNVPILAYGLDETAKFILEDANAGKNFDFYDHDLKSIDFIMSCIKGDFKRDEAEDGKLKYERKYQTQQLARIFDDVWNRRNH